MITFTVIAILGVLLAIVLVQLSKKKPAAAPARPAADLANLKIADARLGDIVSIPGAGDDLGDLDFTVDRVTRFEAGERRWSELSGTYRGRHAAVRVGGGDELEAAVLASSPSLEDLGLAEDDLTQMDQRQNTGDSFDFDGQSWFYRISREARASRDGQPQSTGFYYWEFDEQAGKRLAAIRKPEGEPFAAAVYNRVHAEDITVLRNG